MDQSIFTDKEQAPSTKDLETALGTTQMLWAELVKYIFDHCPQAYEEWNYSKFGWNYRVKDSKRVVVYFMPCNGYFKASVVLGKKAVADALNSKISQTIKQIILNAKVYAEGTGIRVDVQNDTTLKDIKQLVEIKLRH
ncbi:MAG TPA: DUF3788 domain-containing protein [Flavipsychrobacter sp.]